jgi:ribose transport system ATP-binding protein
VRKNAPTVALEVRGISKTFGATRALSEASFSVQASTVHGLLGENGSGKSTLVKILSGYHSPDPGGSVQVWGSEVSLPIRPGGFREIGMSFVHQSLALTQALSVVENLAVAEVTRPRRLAIRWRRERSAAKEVLERYGVDLDPARPVGDLTRSEQSMLAIVRAVEELQDDGSQQRRGLLILDEPSGAFSLVEKEWLYRTIRAFTGQGGAVMFISHDIDEIFEITDEVTVLRDGRVQATLGTQSVDGTQLAELIVGRHVVRGDRRPLDEGSGASDSLARISGLSGGTVEGVDLEVRSGEVLGITGLAGSGFEAILPLIFGAVPAVAGLLEIDGHRQELSHFTPQAALRSRIALVPGEREREGCVLGLSITDNVTLASLDDYASLWGLHRGRMGDEAGKAIANYAIRAPSATVTVGSLSGGNQQKVLLAKWLATRPMLLLLQEPTIGLDIGARLDILALIRTFAGLGTGVICASSDWEQLAEICDRVIILANGRVAAVLAGDDVTESGIGHECYRVSTHHSGSAGIQIGLQVNHTGTSHAEADVQGRHAD